MLYPMRQQQGGIGRPRAGLMIGSLEVGIRIGCRFLNVGGRSYRQKGDVFVGTIATRQKLNLPGHIYPLQRLHVMQSFLVFWIEPDDHVERDRVGGAASDLVSNEGERMVVRPRPKLPPD